MSDIAASVLARLKNKAKETGRSYQVCLQLFCQEEFLRRLQNSKYAKKFVLKGGLFLYAITEFDSRLTVDVDFLVHQIPNTPEQIRFVLEEIIAVPSENDFVSFEITDISPIAITKKYPGIGATLVAKIKNTRTPFGVDIGIGDVIVPSQQEYSVPTQLEDFIKPVINTYSIESTIAEKIDAILSLMEFSSRMKDYYDIYYLSQKFNFDGHILVEALKKTFVNRDHHFTIEQFQLVLNFANDYAMQKKWNAFVRKINTKTVDFDIVLSKIKGFLEEPLIATFENKDYSKQWLFENGQWSEM